MIKDSLVDISANFSLYDQMIENSLSFNYYGDFTNNVNDALIPLAETMIEGTKSDFKIRKRAFYIMVECIQNINRHHFNFKLSSAKPKEILTVNENRGSFNIALGNIIKAQDVTALRSKIEKLNSLSVKALNTHYKTILRENILSNNGGAGLGLIEVARKSGNKMDYKFRELDNKCSLFSMDTWISESRLDETIYRSKGVDYVDFLFEFYKRHNFGLMLKNHWEYFDSAVIDRTINYLNRIKNPSFFSNNESAKSINGILKFIRNSCYKFSDLSGRDLILHFESKKEENIFNIAWVVPDKKYNYCYQNIKKLLEEISKRNGNAIKNSESCNFLKLICNLTNESSLKVVFETSPVDKEDHLFVLQMPFRG